MFQIQTFMDSQLASSSRQSVSSLELREAWKLFVILLKIGRPARPSEIARRCTLFNTEPHLVERLCFVPDSPLFLRRDRFVVPSCTASVALQRFFSMFSSRSRSVPAPDQIWEDVVLTYSRRLKRKRAEPEVLPLAKTRILLKSACDDEDNQIASPLPNGALNQEAAGMPVITSELNNLQNAVFEITLPLHLINGELISGCEDFEHKDTLGGMEANSSEYLHQGAMFYHFQNVEHNKVTGSEPFMPHMVQTLSCPSMETPFLKENEILDDAIYDGDSAVPIFSLLEAEIDGHACETTNIGIHESDEIAGIPQGNPFHFANNGQFADIIQSFSYSQMEISHKSDSQTINNGISSSIRKKGIVLSQATLSATELPSVQIDQLSYHSSELKIFPAHKENPKQQVVCEKLIKGLGSPKKQQLFRRDDNLAQLTSKRRKTEQMRNSKEKLDCFKDKRENPNPTTIKNPQEVKPLPNFDSFTVEEEEGSGGYGTVYKAHRKEDGKIFAIKCPHAKANKYHVHNELKMLERFGGRNFVIKYEGSFKNGDSEYIVLEHVEHDRPEVLKREIDVSQLQWYGYCMFRALAGLHKQGIVHRDVKPGNFLFSRKFNKGFLIDFNLALDLHHKYGKSDKPMFTSTMTSNQVPLPPTKSTFHGKHNLPIGKSHRSAALLKNQRKRSGEFKKDAGPDLEGKNGLKSQGENGSGLTSTRTPSGERLREPVPCQGRKELLNFAQKVMHSTANTTEPLSLASSKRKRVAALPGRIDKRYVYLTPMSLRSHGIPVAGAGPAHNKKGDGKHKQEGPCVGTKGFRAPEVLLRSSHQGPKLDIWSAGVTLLYFLIGRAPFTGEPEQNIKEIAKLRGSEDIWEVAKIHDREASFPSDLLDTHFLQSTNILEWCIKNTKRKEFLEQIPKTMIDLVDKCLIVNPRMRLTAEEALKHPFFETCHDKLKRHRLCKEVQQHRPGK